MPDFDACPPLTPDTALETVACGARAVWDAAVAAPWVAAAVALSALMTLLVGRSAAIGLAVLVLAIVLADTVLSVADPVERQWRIAGAGLSLVLIWIGCLRSRRRSARQQDHIAALQAERDAVQARLDREIVWRRAAEPEEDGMLAPAADRPHPAP